jgi:hypothetical protein
MRQIPGRPGVTSGVLARPLATVLLVLCSALALPAMARAGGFTGQGGLRAGGFGTPLLVGPANLSAVGVAEPTNPSTVAVAMPVNRSPVGVLSSTPAQPSTEPSVVVIAASNIGNRLLRLLAPIRCTPEAALLSLTAQSVTLSGVSGLTNYRVDGAAFYLDGGLKETVLAGKPGHKHSETVFEPQYQAPSLPSTFTFLPSKVGAQAGANPVRVKIALTTHTGKGRHRRTVRVTKTLSSTFNVCGA